MSAQHTPGPWMAAAAPSGIVGWPIVGPGGRSVANVSWSPNHWQAPEEEYAAFVATCEANARIIAAAPDMLKALAAWIEWLEPGSPWREDAADHEEAMLNAMRAAIAKATGGAS